MINLSKLEVKTLFESLQKFKYQKNGNFIFRTATESLNGLTESILTIVAGKLETIKTANPGDIIVRNIMIGSAAETYIISEETFNKRYDILDGAILLDGFTWFKATAKGQILAGQFLSDSFEFVAPWNENMMCCFGDYLASPIGGEPDDIYRIEQSTFNLTYKII